MYWLRLNLTITDFLRCRCQIRFELNSFQPRPVSHRLMFKLAFCRSTFFLDGGVAHWCSNSSIRPDFSVSFPISCIVSCEMWSDKTHSILFCGSVRIYVGLRWHCFSFGMVDVTNRQLWLVIMMLDFPAILCTAINEYSMLHQFNTQRLERRKSPPGKFRIDASA